MAKEKTTPHTTVLLLALQGEKTPHPTIVGWRQGIFEPSVDLVTGEAVFYKDNPKIPNTGNPQQTFTILLRGPEPTQEQDIPMGVVVAETGPERVKFSRNTPGRPLRRTPPKRVIQRPRKAKTKPQLKGMK